MACWFSVALELGVGLVLRRNAQSVVQRSGTAFKHNLSKDGLAKAPTNMLKRDLWPDPCAAHDCRYM